jgi:outer membrane protein OmpA-like peptidoglycan-associated protein
VAEDESRSAGKPSGGDGEEVKPQESPWTALLKSFGEKALMALFTVGGLAAFAAFAGSLVLWTRFEALGLPGDQIVDLIPREEAITTGTTILLLFGFCGAVAALAVYLIDRGGRATPGMSRGVLVIVAVEAVAAIWLTLGADSLDKVIATEVVLLAFGAVLWVTQVGGLVELEEGAVPDLVEGEPDQEIESDAFLEVTEDEQGHKVQTNQVSWSVVVIVLGIALVAGGRAWLIAWLVADSAPAGWAVGLAAFGFVLSVAVVVQWIAFHRSQKKAKDKARWKAAAEQEKEKRAREEEARKQKRAARAERWVTRTAWLVSWVKADVRRGETDPGYTLSLGAPAALSPMPKHEPEAAEEDPPKEKPPLLQLTPYGKSLVLPLALAVVLVPALILGERWLGITLAATILLGIALWRVAELSSGGFVLFGLAVFLSAPLFGTVALTTRNIDDPQAQPVAIIRGGDGPAEALQGIYVTETSERVYFANVATQGCEKKIVDDSGRLFWIPKDEVVAMAIGPRQDIDKAARASLEMSQALTPDVENPEGGHLSLVTEDQAAVGGAGGGTAAKQAQTGGKRLQSTGPAVRPKFGIGLRLEPAIASPGEKVRLVLASPEFGGLGNLHEGRSLRLNGVKLPITASRVSEGQSGEELRREWIEFRVPQEAASGVVTIECSLLAGQPVLTVPQAPVARVTVRMQAGSERVSFDSGRSTAAGRGKLVRRWKVAGLNRGDGVELSASLPPRLAPYPVTLTVTDSEGQTDEVDLRILRLPDSRFPLGADRPKDEKAVRKVRRAVRKALEASTPAAIELDGHADAVDTDSFNLRLSLHRAQWMREHLFALHGRPADLGSGVVNPDDPVPMTIRAFGESCPIVHSPGPQEVNRRVEVFLLDPGAIVSTAKGCHSDRIKRMNW